ncbi:hypothetical protein CR205_15910 [Alteribacter lacisalsi]|uniref:Glycosyl hydrolase family 13 catalytic domain-containing protein n=1 Tax=Alteribacter lacisalsi TaxID=2045244 RepID=A0A2W0H5H4_9BACI|nr:alpha-amylase family glycosyl hydrolase [Alteribacter lacisalsi]PYZ95866.1 hypothetical protein CR205_15910 [Alteribacter lacisalsi]
MFKRTFALTMAFVLVFTLFAGSLGPVQTASADDRVYDDVVVRGSVAPLDWSSNNNPLTFNEDESVWVSEPMHFEGGQEIEYKFVMDGTWMEGANLRFTPPQTAEYQFVFHPNDERRVDVRIATEFDAELTLILNVPEGTPEWVTPTVASNLNGYNYEVTPMVETDGQYTLTLGGEEGDELSYFYGLGDDKFREIRDEARTAEFTADGAVYEDTVTEWTAVPIAQSVHHDFNHDPFVPEADDDVTVTATVEHYGDVDDAAAYFTADGTSPDGARGEAVNGQAVDLTLTGSEEDEDTGRITSTFEGDIPAQSNGTPVKYKIDVWSDELPGSQFADNNSIEAAGATEFAYYVDDFTSPEWAKNAIIYHIFVDRFKDGNEDNNYDTVDPDDVGLEEALKSWMGGDIDGILEKIDYLDDLGVDTLWLSPVFEGPYSHGYHPESFFDIDRNFGSEETLVELIDEAHDRDMKVIYDMVPNHTSDKHPYFQDALENGADSDYYNWYTFYEDGSYDSFYGIAELPELNNDNQETRDYMLEEVVPYWIEEIGFDGYRLDYVKGPSYSFWVDFRHAVQQLDGDVYTFGEIWDDRDKINSYSGKLDGALDFGFHDSFKNAFAYGGGMNDINNTIIANESVYHPEYIMTSFLDNHDVPRFFFEIDEDEALLKMASTMQFALPGSPVIYYGTEVGLSQSADHNDYDEWQDRWYREMMPWDEEDQNLDLLAHYQDIIELRQNHDVLTDGSYQPLYVNNDVLAFERKNDDEQMMVVANKGGSVTLDVAEMYNQMEIEDVTLTNVFDSSDVHETSGGTIELPAGERDFAIYAVSGELMYEDDPVDEDRKYQEVVLRGEDPFSWDGSDDPLTWDEDEKVWKSEPITLTGGEPIEFKYVMDGEWLDGDNLVFTPEEDGSYVFHFHPHDERRVDVQFYDERKVYEEVLLRGSDPLSWEGSDHPLEYDSGEGVWKSDHVSLTEGEQVEFKFVMDGEWLEGDNLTFTPESGGDHIFVFDALEPYEVDVRFDAVEVERIFGENRFETAVEVSKTGWDASGTVVLASGHDFPDALAGGPLAYEHDAPVLLTHSDRLTEVTEEEIVRLGAQHAVILGGTMAVGEDVAEALEAHGIAVDRIGGENRYETAELIAHELETSTTTAFIASGSDYPDALSAAPYAAGNGSPILLTRKDEVPAETWRGLAGKFNLYVIGGENVISEAAFRQFDSGFWRTATRVAGENRYDTSREVVSYFDQGSDRAFVATGREFADSLTGSVLAAKHEAPMLLVSRDYLPEPIEQLLDEKNFRHFSVLGGENAISQSVLEQLQ